MTETFRKRGWTGAVGAFFAATLALAFSVLAVEQSRIDTLPRLAAIGSDATSGLPFEFDPLVAASHYAIQPRSDERGKDGAPPDLIGGAVPPLRFQAFLPAFGVTDAASERLPGTASHADARAPPAGILNSATL